MTGLKRISKDNADTNHKKISYFGFDMLVYQLSNYKAIFKLTSFSLLSCLLNVKIKPMTSALTWYEKLMNS